jgi:hypothetical protein
MGTKRFFIVFVQICNAQKQLGVSNSEVHIFALQKFHRQKYDFVSISLKTRSLGQKSPPPPQELFFEKFFHPT